jgi:hypothetical protein
LTCGSCHTVSRDGRTIAFVAEQTGYLAVARTDNPAQPLVSPRDPPQAAATMSLNRDGTLLLVSYGTGTNDGQLVVRDSSTGQELHKLDPAVLGTPERKLYFPEWSPDGTQIVATLATQSDAPWSVKDGVLVVFPYNGGSFGPARVVAPKDPGLFHFYPSWSPDGRWIVFASAPMGGKSYNNADSRLRLISSGGGKVYELGNATQGLGFASSVPRFLPFTQACDQLLFVVFNTRIDYGYLLRNSANAMPTQQLWLATIDLRKLGTADASSAPVWLPFQDLHEKNVLPTWVEHLTCPCGEGTLCQSNECVPAPP